ncbi:mating-type HMG-box protein MAT1-2 [Penicillium malachiteum]|nr:mating-type HMG-box protein MAT1-2 [Penicillium malachiteum]
MPAAQRVFWMPSSEADQLTEALWHEAGTLERLKATNNELILPNNVVAKIGRANVAKLATRLSMLIKRAVQVLDDPTIQAVRLLPIFENAQALDWVKLDHIARQVKEAVSVGQVERPRAGKIPRPMNSWILYRQHHHRAVAEANPDMPNTEISKVIAAQWHDEPVETRDEWRELSQKMKAEHERAHPDYQYSPRRPGERRTRRSRIRVRTDSVEDFMVDTARGEQRLRDSILGNGPNPWDSNGFVDIDEELMTILDDHNLLRGFNAIFPNMGQPLCDEEFAAMVDAQVNGEPIERLQWTPLKGDEFGPEFTEADMEGAFSSA